MEFFVSFEFSLYSGIPIDVDAKIQINTLIQPIPGFKWVSLYIFKFFVRNINFHVMYNFRLFKQVPTVMIPAFWFAQTVELNEDIAKDAKVR